MLDFLLVFSRSLKLAGKVLLQTALVRNHILSSAEMVHPFILLLRNGGFCDCDSQGQVCAVSSVSFQGEAALLQFGEAVSGHLRSATPRRPCLAVCTLPESDEARSNRRAAFASQCICLSCKLAGFWPALVGARSCLFV